MIDFFIFLTRASCSPGCTMQCFIYGGRALYCLRDIPSPGVIFLYIKLEYLGIVVGVQIRACDLKDTELSKS